MSNVTVMEKIEPQTSGVTVATPMEMLDRAITNGAQVEVLEKLFALQERWEKNQGRKAFDIAIAEAKAEIAPVVRNAEGHNKKRYADFAAIARAVDPIISKHGLSYRFRTTQTDKISVTCILSHKDGHSEETTLSGPPDMTGNKNAIQAIGSTLTYLQRYSLVQALGLAASTDDDGRAAGAGELIDADGLAELRDKIAAVSADETKFARYLKVATLEDLPASRFDAAVEALEAHARRNARAS